MKRAVHYMSLLFSPLGVHNKRGAPLSPPSPLSCRCCAHATGRRAST